MSINMSDDEVNVSVGDAPYSDHEHINVALTAGADANGGSFDETFSLEPLAEELDSNEVAELVYLDRNISVDRGNVEFGLGINVGGEGGFIEQAAAFQNNDDDIGGNGNAVIFEEAGILDFAQGGKPDENQGSELMRQVNYGDTYSSGPFVDSTDDLDVHLEHTNRTGSSSNLGVQVQLVWATYEVAQGIPEFADPRRLMGD